MRMQVLQCWHLLKRAAAVQFWQRNENLMKINYFTSVGHLCRNLRTYLHKKSCCLSFRFFVHLGGIDDFYIFHVKCWVWLIHQCSVSSSLFPVKYFFFLQSIPIHPTDNDTFLNIIGGVLARHTENINKNGEVGRLVPLIDSRGRIPHQVVVTITSFKKMSRPTPSFVSLSQADWQCTRHNHGRMLRFG